MSALLSDLNDFNVYNANSTYTITTLDGDIIQSVAIAGVFSDGVLVTLEPPAESPRRYIPLSAIAGVDVTGTLEYLNPPPPPEE